MRPPFEESPSKALPLSAKKESPTSGEAATKARMKTRCATLLALSLLALHCAADEYNANWPRFRGPDGSGVYAKEVPLTCDGKTGANIAWSVEVPAAGFGSPVIWGDKVFLSGGDEEKREVMCFDVASGKLLWRSAVPPAAEKPEVPDQSGMAAATTATDGKRVYAMFANGELGAFDFEGKVVWSKHLPLTKNPYGHAASLLTWQENLIVQLDQGEADDKLSKLTVYDGAKGTVVWEQPRTTGASWATPIVFEAAGQTQLITLSVPFAIAYNVKDGSELWRAECLDGEVTPSPIFAGGLVLVPSPASKIQAFKPDGKGDVTKSHTAWIAEDGIPDVTSPVSNGELVFVFDNGGVLTCYDAKTGKKQWQQDLGESCNASPSIATNKLYLLTKEGKMIVVEVARAFKELARSNLGEQIFASPAFTNNKMIVRGIKHLICVESKTK